MAYLNHEHIYSFEDFISIDDRLELIRFYDEDFEWDDTCSWVAPISQYNNGPVEITGAYADEIKRRKANWSNNVIHPLMLEYGAKIMKLATAIYGRTLVHRLEPYLKKFLIGSSHSPHADSEAVDREVVDYMPQYSASEFNTPILIEVAANLYLNDDYSGGELWFPFRDLKIKPKAGQLILFPGGHEYIHGVTEVIGSPRYVFFSPLTSPQRLLMHANAYNIQYELDRLRDGK